MPVAGEKTEVLRRQESVEGVPAPAPHPGVTAMPGGSPARPPHIPGGGTLSWKSAPYGRGEKGVNDRQT